jgi:hypothetical protein
MEKFKAASRGRTLGLSGGWRSHRSSGGSLVTTITAAGCRPSRWSWFSWRPPFAFNFDLVSVSFGRGFSDSSLVRLQCYFRLTEPLSLQLSHSSWFPWHPPFAFDCRKRRAKPLSPEAGLRIQWLTRTRNCDVRTVRRNPPLHVVSLPQLSPNDFLTLPLDGIQRIENELACTRTSCQ